MLLKVDCLPNAVGKQPSITLIYLGRKCTLNWWWWWWWSQLIYIWARLYMSQLYMSQTNTVSTLQNLWPVVRPMILSWKWPLYTFSKLQRAMFSTLENHRDGGFGNKRTYLNTICLSFFVSTVSGFTCTTFTIFCLIIKQILQFFSNCSYLIVTYILLYQCNLLGWGFIANQGLYQCEQIYLLIYIYLFDLY